MITSEEEKCQKFEKGLHYDIRNRLTPYDLENYSRLMAAAIRAERLAKERKAYFSNQKESSSRSGKRKDRTFSSSRDESSSRYSGPKKGGADSSSQSGQRSNTNQRPLCDTCGRHHFGECWKKTGGCYQWGDQGHRIRDCLRRQATSGVRSEPTVQGIPAPGVPAGRSSGQSQSASAGPSRGRPVA